MAGEAAKESVEAHVINGNIPWDSRLLRLAWTPILVFIVAIGALTVLDIDAVWNPPDLIPALNIVFLTGISFFISLLAARSYLVGRSPEVLLLGCGTLALGLGGIGASLYLAGPGTNSMISVYNTMACLAGLCHLLSATMNSVTGPGRLRSGWPYLLFTYLAIIVAIAALILMVRDHIWPVHFVNGSGQTAFGLAILWTTAATFGLSAALLAFNNAAGARNFRRWYGLGLGLIATGLVGVSLQTSLGDPLNWTGRIAEYLGTVYMLIAVFVSISAGGDWKLPLEDALRASEERYRTFFENSFDAILITTPDVGVDMANPAACQMFGMTEEELIRAGRAGTVDMSDPRLGPALEERMRTGRFRGELNFKRKDGTIFPVEESNVLYTDMDGKQKSVMIIRDITERKYAEEALKSERDFTRAILDHANALVAVFDSEGRIVTFNKNCEDSMGYTFEEVRGKPFWDLFIEDQHKDAMRNIFRKIRDSRVAARGENYWKTRNGLHRIIEWSNTVMLDENGQTRHVVSIGIDVTERKQAEEALRESEEKYRTIVETAKEGIWIVDSQGRTTFVNSRMAEMLGAAREEIIGKGVSAFTDEEGLAIAVMNLERRKQGIRESHEYKFIRKDGSPLWAIVSSTPLTDSQGRFTGSMSMITDITARKQAETALEQSRQQLKDILNSIQDGFFELDREWRFTYINHRAARNGNYEPEELIGERIWDKFPYMRGTRFETVYRKVMKTRQPERFEIKSSIKDSWYDISIYPSAAGITGYWKDITESKRAEEALKEAKQQAELYLDLMGHDINNMHQIATGYLELASEYLELDENSREIVEKPLDVLRRSSKLIDNVRKLQRLHAGNIKDSVVDLGEILSRVVTEYRDLAGGNIAYSNGTGPFPVVANDLLYDVFSNLVGNAIKHSNGNAAEIAICVDMVQENGQQYYKVCVDDTGPGISDDMKVRVFNRLHRGETKARGMGLGLYLVRSLVGSYGGRVWVEDRVPGDHTKGSRFVVLLPAV